MNNNWLDDLLLNIPGAELTTVVPSRTTGELPREVLARNIEHNIKLADDPTYRVKGRKKEARPERFFAVTEDFANVWLAYGRIKLDLNGKGKDAIRVPKTDLKGTLMHLKKAVEAEAFDEQLELIKRKRVAKQKAGHDKKKAAA